MAWQHLRIALFGGPEVLELAEQPTIPDPGPGEVRIKVLAAGTGFTDTFIRRGRYPDFKGPLPFTPGYDVVGVVEETGPGALGQLAGQLVADLCVVGGYAQYAIRPARFLVPVPDGVDLAEAVCIPLNGGVSSVPSPCTSSTARGSALHRPTASMYAGEWILPSSCTGAVGAGTTASSGRSSTPRLRASRIVRSTRSKRCRSRPFAFETTTSFRPRSRNAARAGTTSSSTCSHKLSWR